MVTKIKSLLTPTEYVNWDPLKRGRWTIYLYSCLVFVVCGSIAAFVLLAKGDLVGFRPLTLASVAAVLLTIGLKTNRFEVLSWILVTAMSAVFVSGSIHLGGIVSPQLALFPVIPVLAFQLLGDGGGKLFAAATFAFVIFLLRLHQ